MKTGVISALVRKDAYLFFQNKFVAMISIVGLIFYILIYYLMPSTVDESIELGLFAPILPPTMSEFEEEGLVLVRADTEASLKRMVEDGEVTAGLSINPAKATITVYYSASIPAVVRDQIDLFLDELSYLISGVPLPMDATEEVIGIDMSGRQVPFRDRMKPMLLFMAIMFETLGLANLIAEEIENRTLQAISLTPMSSSELYVAKGITGGTIAFLQVIVLMIAIRGLSMGGGLIIVSLLLGALLSVGLGFLIGSLAKDFMSVLYVGILILIPLFLPGIAVLTPGVASAWVKVIPTYYLVDALSRIANYGARWGDVWRSLAILASIDAVLIFAGILSLRRRGIWA